MESAGYQKGRCRRKMPRWYRYRAFMRRFLADRVPRASRWPPARGGTGLAAVSRPRPHRRLRRTAARRDVGRRRAAGGLAKDRRRRASAARSSSRGGVILFHRARRTRRSSMRSMPRTGAAQWRYAYPTAYRDDFGFDEGPRAVPVVADGVVYTFGAEGQLHAIDLAKGTRIWSVDTMQRFEVPKGFFGAAGLRSSKTAACSPTSAGRRPASSPSRRRPGRSCGPRPTRGQLFVADRRDDRRTPLRDFPDARGARRARSGDRAGAVSAAMAGADRCVGQRGHARGGRRPDFRLGASTVLAPASCDSRVRR